jgi:hypothetical protein
MAWIAAACWEQQGARAGPAVLAPVTGMAGQARSRISQIVGFGAATEALANADMLLQLSCLC